MNRLLLTSVVAAIHTAAAQPAPLDTAAMNAYLERAEAVGFSGAVIVAVGNQPIIRRGYGLANRETRTEVTPETPFYVASVTKQFVAAGILRLESKGRLRTSDTLGSVFEGLPPAAAGITIHQLLTHTAGTPRADGAEVGAEPYVRRLFAKPLQFTPGSRFAYSNQGYGVLAAIIEKRSGLRFADFMRRELFEPAGLRSTYDIAEAPPAVRTMAYRGDNTMGDVRLSFSGAVPWDERAGRGIITSVADLWRWELALRGNSILSEAAKARMFTAERDRYGYGWVIARTSRGSRLIMHDGLIFPEGWNAQFRRYVDEGVTILVTSNAFRRESLSEVVAVDLGRIIFGGAPRMPPDVRPTTARERSELVGVYALPKGAEFRITEAGRQLRIAGVGQAAINLLQFNALSDSAALGGLALATSRVANAVIGDSLASVAEDLATVQPIDAWRSELRATIDSLAGRYGLPRRVEVIGVAADDTSGRDAQSFVRVSFERASVSMRYAWRNFRLIGVSNLGSYPRGIRAVEELPGTVPLARSAASGWVAYDLATTRSRWFRAVRDSRGRVTALEVLSGDGAVTAVRRSNK